MEKYKKIKTIGQGSFGKAVLVQDRHDLVRIPSSLYISFIPAISTPSFICACACIYIYTYIHVYVHVYIYILIFIHLYIYLYA